MEKVSDMMLSVAGDLLTTAQSREEMQVRLEMVQHAWNLSLLPKKQRLAELQCFITSQAPYAPDAEALRDLEWQYRRIMRQRMKYFPYAHNTIKHAEAIETDKDNYLIRAYFTIG